MEYKKMEYEKEEGESEERVEESSQYQQITAEGLRNFQRDTSTYTQGQRLDREISPEVELNHQKYRNWSYPNNPHEGIEFSIQNQEFQSRPPPSAQQLIQQSNFPYSVSYTENFPSHAPQSTIYPTFPPFIPQSVPTNPNDYFFYQQALHQEVLMHQLAQTRRNTFVPNVIPNENLSFQSVGYSGSIFILHEQPSPRQRRCREFENRYLTPNPLTICPRDPHHGERFPNILYGTVTVKIAEKSGHVLPDNKQSILVVGEGESNTKPLSKDLKTSFSLKVTQTFPGKSLRLLFIINFVAQGLGSKEERILSRAFNVYEDRTKILVNAAPVVYDMKPREGTAETEVWIKGKGFGERVRVDFDNKVAKIVDTAENLITATVPPFDFTSITSVRVTTSNTTIANELLPAEKKLNFTYYPPDVSNKDRE